MCIINRVNITSNKEKFIRALIERVQKVQEFSGLIVFGSIFSESCGEDTGVNYATIGSLPEFEGFSILDEISSDILKNVVWEDNTGYYYSNKEWTIDSVKADCAGWGRGEVVWTR